MSKQANSYFQRGSGVFSCTCCGRQTRNTGIADPSSKLCEDCWELAGIYNAFQDGGEEGVRLYAPNVINHCANIVKKGGKLDGENQELLDIAKRFAQPTDEEKTMSSKKANKTSSKKTPAKKPASKKLAAKKAPAKKVSKAAKREVNTDQAGRLHASTVESPVAVMWELCQSMKGAKRKDVIAAAQKKGVAFYTARTQYQLWLQAARNSK